MAGQAYDSQNQQDFDAVTESINEALLKMASDSSIKATASELARISGVHRNTIGNREWPAERLRAIKEQRKKEAERAKEQADLPSQEEVLAAQLEKARLEILYWFRQHNAKKGLHEAVEENARLLSKSKRKLEEEVDRLRSELAKLKGEYDRVCDLLNSVDK